MKTTAICKFDRSAVLVNDNKLMTFPNYEELEEYCEKNNIKVEIHHLHPAGLTVNHG